MIEKVFSIIIAAAINCISGQVTKIEPQAAELEINVPKEVVEMKQEKTWEAPMPEEHLAHLVACCEAYEVPVEVVLALIERESQFQQDAVSVTNDYGYMQINKCHFESAEALYNMFPENNPFDNIEYGIRLLKTGYDTYETWGRSLMLYAEGYEAFYNPGWAKGFDDRSVALMKRAEEILENGAV